MAVPSSGELSLNSIYNELDDNNYSGGTTNSDVSLTNLSTGGNPPNEAINTAGNDAADRPNGSVPHAMSEFYSYDHDASGVAAPTSLTYAATSTTTVTYGFTEASSTTRVYVYLYDYNGDTDDQDGQIDVDGSTHITVDGSGTESFVIGNGDDTYEPDETETITLAANDYLTLRYKSWASSVFSAFSSTIQGWTLPGTVSVSLGSETTSQIVASWSAPTGGASSYIVYKDTSNFPTSQYATPSGTSQTITSLSPNTRYYVRVKAVGGGGDSGAYSVNANTYTLPNAPSNLTTGRPGTNSMPLSWDAPSGGASSYKVESQAPLSGWVIFATGVTDTSDYSVTGLSSGLEYNFRVSAANAGGAYGAVSNTATETTA